MEREEKAAEREEKRAQEREAKAALRLADQARLEREQHERQRRDQRRAAERRRLYELKQQQQQGEEEGGERGAAAGGGLFRALRSFRSFFGGGDKGAQAKGAQAKVAPPPTKQQPGPGPAPASSSAGEAVKATLSPPSAPPPIAGEEQGGGRGGGRRGRAAEVSAAAAAAVSGLRSSLRRPGAESSKGSRGKSVRFDADTSFKPSSALRRRRRGQGSRGAHRQHRGSRREEADAAHPQPAPVQAPGGEEGKEDSRRYHLSQSDALSSLNPSSDSLASEVEEQRGQGGELRITLEPLSSDASAPSH